MKYIIEVWNGFKKPHTKFSPLGGSMIWFGLGKNVICVSVKHKFDLGKVS